MGVQKKHGKGRLDKWYKLAKEKGYRARAAFKLIQLNKKYGFLERSKVLLDLCAAPGSWCQVAADTMPANSLIIGVDLAPIKPVPRTITFQSDIATDKCRATIRQHLKTWKADTVLHDGAPNVGTAWVQDAFSQAELVLQAMKLATDFLIEGGTFVTKIFRSKDYNSLLWVFNQLFAKVEATKPPSSRNVSAEIFVVCQGFKAPRRIDPKFLDPRSVFAELTGPTPNNEAKVFNPEKKRRRREGYEENDYLQYKEATASQFVQTPDPIAMLGSLNKLSFQQATNGDIALAALDRLPETSPEIRQCCDDLKVLGRKEFRMLLRWRLKAREKFGLATSSRATANSVNEEVVEVKPIDDELRIHEELQTLHDKETSRTKRERRRENERKQKEIIRMQLHMMPPTEIGLEQAGPTGEDSIFALKTIDKAGATEEIARGRIASPAYSFSESNASGPESQSEYEEDQLDRELESMYELYREKRSQVDVKHRAKKARQEFEDDDDWGGITSDGKASPSDSEAEEDQCPDGRREDSNLHLIYDPDQATVNDDGLTRRASQFFNQGIFKSIDGLGTEESAELDEESSGDTKADEGRTFERRHQVELNAGLGPMNMQTNNKSKTVFSVPSQGVEVPINDMRIVQMSNKDEEAQSRPSDFEIVKSSGDDGWLSVDEPTKNGRLDIDIITAEAMTLAQQIASGERSSHDLVDEGFNRYTFRDRDGLPEWFLDDEDAHSKLQKPVTASGALAIKEKLRALNARPIKKVREAKDRKKFKAAQKLEKLRKKSALIADEDGMTEKDKAQSIAKIMNKAAKKKPKQHVKLVVARGGNKGISGRPRGVKGKYKIVDARLKKDTRAEKRLVKRRS